MFCHVPNNSLGAMWQHHMTGGAPKCDAIMKHCTSCGRATGRQPWGPATCCSQISTSRGPVLMDFDGACTYDCDRPSIEELRLLVVKALFIGEGEGDSTDGNEERVASKRDVVVALERHGFSKDVAQWVVTNLRESSPSDSSPSSFSWVFDLNGIAEMYQSYEETSLWKIVEDVPRGVHVNFLKAERSLHRWALEDLQRIHVAEELAADEGGGVEMHVLEDAGHWCHFTITFSFTVIVHASTIDLNLTVIVKLTLNAKSLRYMQITPMVSSRFSLSRFRVYINENFGLVLQL
ncbi:hypothetical protein RHGRI_005264 [Rhododendron griersonianum]|uniref:Uncharacterized protein n=1 Tax=Rhododendron griersonianum TaxID=479676 RepID=A0AAV6LCV1_9ERIC|nr:hypothetical protein RHGRI_005264 [Rhododendron griersonianum]